MRAILLAVAIFAVLGCKTTPPAAVAPDVVAETASPADVSVPVDVSATVAAALAAAAKSGKTVRFIVHLHSVFSKDACDGHGLDAATGKIPDSACFASLRKGLCQSGLDVANLTDHPTHMKDFEFTALLLHDPALGDTLVQDAQGRPWANTLHCKPADGLPAHDVTLTVGFEGDHLMPIGLHGHLPVKDHYKLALADDTPLQDLKDVVSEVHALSGVVVNAHSEGDAIGAVRLVEAGVDAMEIYNIHANVLGALLGNFENLFWFEPWWAKGADQAHPDLAIVPLLQQFPEPAYTKWHVVQKYRAVTGLVGSDAHENVSFPQLCGSGGLLEDLCAKHAKAAPHAVQALGKEGPVILGDGERFDSYRRMLRWYSDRARLTDDGTPLAQQVINAVKTGNVYTVWNVFGEPDLVSLLALKPTPQQTVLAMHWPKVVADPWSPFTSELADQSPRQLLVWQITDKGAEIVATYDGKNATGGIHAEFGRYLWMPVTQAGKYHLELRIQPLHLAKPLASAANYAQLWARWVVTNPITVDL